MAGKGGLFFFQAEDGIRDVGVPGAQWYAPHCGNVQCPRSPVAHAALSPRPGCPAAHFQPGTPPRNLLAPANAQGDSYQVVVLRGQPYQSALLRIDQAVKQVDAVQLYCGFDAAIVEETRR